MTTSQHDSLQDDVAEARWRLVSYFTGNDKEERDGTIPELDAFVETIRKDERSKVDQLIEACRALKAVDNGSVLDWLARARDVRAATAAFDVEKGHGQ